MPRTQIMWIVHIAKTNAYKLRRHLSQEQRAEFGAC